MLLKTIHGWIEELFPKAIGPTGQLSPLVLIRKNRFHAIDFFNSGQIFFQYRSFWKIILKYLLFVSANNSSKFLPRRFLVFFCGNASEGWHNCCCGSSRNITLVEFSRIRTDRIFSRGFSHPPGKR
jgi:hypothetical protein